MERSFADIDERFSYVSENYARIMEKVSFAAQKTGRESSDIEFVAVTKTVPVEIINHAISLGVSHIGENRVQELASKYEMLSKDGLEISVIGHLQTNKVKQALGMARMIQSVDSERLALEISKRASEMGKTIECLIEVNIGDEVSKSGIGFDEAEELVCKTGELPGIKVSGLMVIPPFDEKIEKTRRYFEKIHKLFIDIGAKNYDNKNIAMNYLSMGMSSDYEEAVLEGSNMIRVGSALFGRRNYTV